MTEAGQERSLGRLEGKVDILIDMTDKAREERKQQYHRMEQLERGYEAMGRTVNSIDSRLEKVEGPVAEFSRWKERGVGAMMLVSFIAATFGALLATFWKKISALFMG